MTRATGRTKRLAIAMAITMLIAGLSSIGPGPVGRRAPGPAVARAASEPTTSVAGGAGDPRLPAATPAPAQKTRVQAALAKLPLYFVRNRGQEDSRVAYYVQGHNTAVYFGADGVTFALTAPTAAGDDPRGSRSPVRRVSTGPDRAATTDRTVAERWAVKLDFVGASRVAPTAHEPAPAAVSYFTGGARRAGGAVETYRGLTYPELWPGIDLVYTGSGGQLKSTFVVKPGADPGRIRLAYRGATGVRVTDAGRLEVSTPVGGFADDRPYAYQEASGGRHEVPVAFALAAAADDGSRRYGFQVGAYDPSRTLVLDPSLLVYAGYIGGGDVDEVYGVAVDAAGSAYVVGRTFSHVPSFPVKVGPDLDWNGVHDAFIAKVKADGSDFVYVGYIGGGGADIATGVAVDAAGSAYVTGYTASDQSTFPVKVGPDLTFNGVADAFVAKVSPDGASLVYCGYVGGADTDEAYGIAVDGTGSAYLTGRTMSDESTFPVAVGPDLVYQAGFDGFVAKVKPDGSGLVYAGYIGGAAHDFASGIAVDAGGSAYVAGSTRSNETTFPVKIGPDLVHSGGEDGFVAKVKADGTGFVYAGYIGGSGDDAARAIAVDAGGHAYVTGNTDSDQVTFPVKVGPSLWFAGFEDAFVAKVKTDGTGLVYAGYIGGDDADGGLGIAVDSAGSAYVTGFAYSDELSFPVHVGPSLQHGGGMDAFVTKVRADGTGLQWSGYIGGASNDHATGIALGPTGDVYVAGTTGSSEATFPVTVGPALTYNGSTADGFVARVSAKPDLYESFAGLTASAVKPGATLGVADIVANGGLGTAPASSTRYYLSKDIVKDAGDVLLTGSRSVPSLLPGATHTGSVTVTVPSGTPVGDYHLIACADEGKAAAEVDETNNCKSTASVVHVAWPDLFQSGVSNPPLTAKPGDKFSITDTVENGGAYPAGKSTTRYYLSSTGKPGAGAFLLGTRAVPALAGFPGPGNTSTGTVSVTIPLNIPAGGYLLLACADDLKAVKESSEIDNCLQASGWIVVKLPNLIVASVANPPASIKRGLAFQATDKVQNASLYVGAGASTTRYYLSKDSTKGVGDVRLAGSRSVPVLGTSQSSSGSAAVTVPSTMTPGVYFLFACADDLMKVGEEVETDNCSKAVSPVTVTQ